ncbi:uncharacterized protein LOC106055294 isoform X1 [Biomphalaria glabrata]|uniref:Uncharacterized protein LOC106055294 isoform X1 n=2 Tax=Biomphalaria glabrata TaxID=6526 RepID=A0A9W2YTF3_BIOGL|nr:uncharacterized protein LOC106055294 isoform X1 [Biomphalaria glabrata]XP_055866015.1 uncharacterized protein LOC106055294 isoform X1 [Biomphalaria glabrata]
MKQAMKKKNITGLMRFSICPTIYFVIYTLFRACEKCDGEQYIFLYGNHSEVNKAKCEIGYVDGLDNYLMTGRVNMSNKNVLAVGLELVTKEHSETSSYYCVIRFVDECHSDQTDSCYCVGTDEVNIFQVIFNITLKHQDSNATVRAVMLLSNHQEIYSNETMLPPVTKLDLTNVSSVLKINEKTVNKDFCIKIVYDSEIKISYQIASTQKVRPQLKITNNNTSTIWTDNEEGTFNLANLGFESASEVDFTFSLCGFNEKYVHCTFIKGEESDSNSTTFLVLFTITLIILIGITIVFIYQNCKSKHEKILVTGMVLETTEGQEFSDLDLKKTAATQTDNL